VSVLVLAGNTVALAATGHSFVLGHVNYTNKQTTLARTTSGTALRVATKYAYNSPFSVNGAGKVANLNADRLDGLDSTALNGVRAKVYRYAFANSQYQHVQQLPALAPGVYLATLSVLLDGATGTQAAPTGAYCEFLQSGSGIAETTHSLVQGSTSYFEPGLSTTTVLTTADGNLVSLKCSASKAWTTSSSFPAEVTLTKLDGATIAAPAASNG
jgi:FlaG/FlaF family flagellin (archaellin)